ncbi:MAG: transposase, partial [Bosea sp.]|nr:transposase [Bosea sp. (in: a-proteobacteria)]
MTPVYSEELKARMVQKLTSPAGPSATSLSHEIGIPQSTLSRWIRQAGRV